MAVFVRVLRLAMLFFNVYDSYKILKLPPPSAQNKGRPSLRAMSQRKRDMKGCLAVWIVWSCFITYERFAESILSLFIPFYDEFKSLAMLFMIMTRARGAEPIYLHIIRPFLKPYTSTIDQLLDFAHVVGDVIFSLAALPFIYVIQWWQRRFGTERESLDTETEASSSASSPVPNGNGQLSHNHTSASHKPVKSTSHRPSKSLQPTTKISSSSLRNQKVSTQSKVSSIPPTKETIAHVSAVNGPLPVNTTVIDGLPVADDWRQYPAFPSAYPPTPLVKQGLGNIAKSTPTCLYPDITEEPPTQDFHSSLLLPHDESDSNHAPGLSDENSSHGVQKEHITLSISNADDSDVSDELMDLEDDQEYESESEDEFNITLRTPEPPVRILTHLGTPGTFSKELSPINLPTSTLTTTTDNEPSLHEPSMETSVPENINNPPTLAGQKRSFQPATNNVRSRTPRVVARGTSVKIARSARSPVKRGTVALRRPTRPPQMSSQPSKIPDFLDPEAIVPSSTITSHDSVQVTKRRRVSASGKTAPVVDPLRSSNARIVSGSNSVRVPQRVVVPRTPTHPRVKTTTKLQTLSSREGSAAVVPTN